MQLNHPLGFGAGDLVEVALAAILILLVLGWRSGVKSLGDRFAGRTVWCMAVLAVLPVALRLALLKHHPVPTPDVYDEFGHLFVADTLRHFRLANPPHALPQFFETFFILQQPTYSSIYPLGQGLVLIFGWAGVLASIGAFCALCYWMLRGWVSPGWALVGGLLAVMEFGPLNQWTNSYWGGGLTAAAGCLVFGALPRLRANARLRDAVLLGAGVGLHMLTRPFETVFLVLSVLLFRLPWRTLLIAGLVALPALGVTLLQNKRVTGSWMTLPYSLSQYEYGVPASLTFLPNATPHRALTPEQEMDYRMQRAFRSSQTETVGSYWRRLLYRTRYYRFYFYAPLYLAALVFLVGIRRYRELWVVLTLALFALGTNFFPAFQYHYLAGVVCLFVLISVAGLELLSRRSPAAARAFVYLCVAQFVIWYGAHVTDNSGLIRYETADAINHGNPERRIAVAREIAGIKGKLLVFVRYWPGHVFQEEWVWNAADIDSSRVVWARDLGEPEDEKLRRYYPDRAVWLLEPDAHPPRLAPYVPEPPPQAEEPKRKDKPALTLEQVR